jgi:hypothetical protein
MRAVVEVPFPARQATAAVFRKGGAFVKSLWHKSTGVPPGPIEVEWDGLLGPPHVAAEDMAQMAGGSGNVTQYELRLQVGTPPPSLSLSLSTPTSSYRVGPYPLLRTTPLPILTPLTSLQVSNVSYIWEGVVGNSGPAVGNKVLKSLGKLENIAVVGGIGFVTLGYNEGQTSMKMFDVENPHSWTDVGHTDLTAGFSTVHGARFSTEICTRHWIPRLLTSSACMHVTNGIPLGCSYLLPVGTVICVQTLQCVRR